jgi:hypothetical protein
MIVRGEALLSTRWKEKVEAGTFQIQDLFFRVKRQGSLV